MYINVIICVTTVVNVISVIYPVTILLSTEGHEDTNYKSPHYYQKGVKSNYVECGK